MDEAKLKLAWANILKSGDGRDVIWSILEECDLYRITQSNETAEMARSEGRRLVGVAILGLMHDADPEAYIKLQKEKIDAP